MIKKWLASVTFMLMLFSVPMTALAASGTISGYPNFRSAPTTSSHIYGNLSNGQSVSVLDKVNSYWYKVRSGGRTGYISSRYIRYGGVSSTASRAGRISAAQRANRIIALGKKLLGTPYQFGAEYENNRRFDCSSLMQYIFKKNAITLPRTSRGQAKLGRQVSKSRLIKGDLLFFTVGSSKRIGHVGVYIGNGKMLHTFGPKGVRIDSIHRSYWKSHFVKAKRIIK